MNESTSSKAFARPARPDYPHSSGLRVLHWTVMLGLWAALFFFLWQSCQHQIGAQRLATRNLVKMSSLSVRLSLKRVDNALRQAGEAFRMGRHSPDELNELLVRLRQECGEVRILALVSASKGVLALSSPSQHSRCITSTLPGLQRTLDQDPVDTLYVGEPFRCPEDAEWLIPISRSFAATGNEPAFLSVALFPARSLSALADTTAVGTRQNCHFILRTGTIITGSNFDPASIGGQSCETLAVAAGLQRASEGLFELRGNDDRNKLVFWQSLAPWPLAVLSTLDKRDALWPGFRDLLVSTGLATLLLCCSLLQPIQRLRVRHPLLVLEPKAITRTIEAPSVSETTAAAQPPERMAGGLELLVECSPTAVATFDAQARCRLASRSWRSRSPDAIETATGQPFVHFFPAAQREKWQEILDACIEGKHCGSELEAFPRDDGSTEWLKWECIPWRDARGSVIGLFAFVEDMTPWKEARSQAQASLQEKDVLLREIHHRVKNNLQLISSLIGLQAAYIKDPQAYALFMESRNRINSMALVHKELYRSKDFSRVNFKECVGGLVEKLNASLSRGKDIVRHIEVEELQFSIDTAIPCGLILNELVTNAYVHAFPQETQGELRVIMYRLDGRICLIVEDNGEGLPADFDPMQAETLGMQIVVTLTQQLRGTLRAESEKGARFFLEFQEAE